MPWICSRPASLHKNHICAFCSYSLNTHMAFPKCAFPTISGDIKLDEPQEVPWPKAPGPKGVEVANSTGKVALATPAFGSLKSHHPGRPGFRRHAIFAFRQCFLHFHVLSAILDLTALAHLPQKHSPFPGGQLAQPIAKTTLTKRALKFSESLDPCGVTKRRSGSWSRRD